MVPLVRRPGEGPHGLSDGHHDVSAEHGTGRTTPPPQRSVSTTIPRPILIIVSPADGSGHNYRGVDVTWTANDNASTVTWYQYPAWTTAPGRLTAALRIVLRTRRTDGHTSPSGPSTVLGNCAREKRIRLTDRHRRYRWFVDRRGSLHRSGDRDVLGPLCLHRLRPDLRPAERPLPPERGEWVQLGGAASQDFS